MGKFVIVAGAANLLEKKPLLNLEGRPLKRPDGSDDFVEVSVLRYRGETVELDEREAVRLTEAGAVARPGSKEARLAAEGKPAQAWVTPSAVELQTGAPQEGNTPPEPEVFDAAAASDDSLLAWLTDSKPNADATVAAAGDDPAVAQRILDAEQAVTAGEPRKSVAEPLQKIIDRQ